MQNPRAINLRSKMQLFLVSGLSGLVLSGCIMNVPSHPPTAVRNKITVAETVERLELFAQPSGLNLSARDRDAVSDFIYQYGNSGQGPLYLNIPANAQGVGVQQAQQVISAHLQNLGIPGSAIQTGQYTAESGTPAPLIVSFRRLTTVPMDCQAGASLTHSSNNQSYNNFGCSQAANLAAMIDNPRQLLTPYDFADAPSVRRTTVLGKYYEGENTATPRPEGQEVASGQ